MLEEIAKVFNLVKENKIKEAVESAIKINALPLKSQMETSTMLLESFEFNVISMFPELIVCLVKCLCKLVDQIHNDPKFLVGASNNEMR